MVGIEAHAVLALPLPSYKIISSKEPQCPWALVYNNSSFHPDVDKSSYVYQKMRRGAFSKWLANASSEVVQREVQDSKFKVRSRCCYLSRYSVVLIKATGIAICKIIQRGSVNKHLNFRNLCFRQIFAWLYFVTLRVCAL